MNTVVETRNFSVLATPPASMVGDNDGRAIQAYLDRYKGHSLRSYTREINKFLDFLRVSGVPGLKVVNIDHIKDYVETLSGSREHYAVTVLNSFFNWLVDVGYRTGNPIAAALRPVDLERAKHRTDKFFRTEDIAVLSSAIDSLAGKLRNYETRRWLFWLLLLTGVRREEIAGVEHEAKDDATLSAELALSLRRRRGKKVSRSANRPPLSMGDIKFLGTVRTADGGQVPNWVLQVIGKGNKAREVPLPEIMLLELSRYRQVLGLSPLPQKNETAPLVCGRDGKAMSVQTIYNNLKALCDAVADELRPHAQYADLVEALEKASPHWMRHTFATAVLNKGADVRVVMDLLGHASINSTMIYQGVGDAKKIAAVSLLNSVATSS